MSNKIDMEEFRIVISKNPEEFKQRIQENASILFDYIYGDNIDNIISIIKEDEENNGNTLMNLLHLEPFSSEIITAFMESKYLTDMEFYEKVVKVKTIASSLSNSLNKKKKEIREESSNADTDNIETKLKELEDEIDKHETTLKQLEEKNIKYKKLQNLKKQIEQIETDLKAKNIKEMENKLRDYKKIQKDIESCNKEIETSKKTFIDLPRDEA